MKLKTMFLVGALAALPLGAVAQDPPVTQQTKETTVVTTTGTVQSFDAGRSITLTKENGDQVTYTINETSEVPKTIEVGKTVTVRTIGPSGSAVVKTITTTTITTTKETKKKSS